MSEVPQKKIAFIEINQIDIPVKILVNSTTVGLQFVSLSLFPKLYKVYIESFKIQKLISRI